MELTLTRASGSELFCNQARVVGGMLCHGAA